MSATGPDRDGWRGEGVRTEQVLEELDRLHRAHTRRGRAHALTRTLNLIVAPASGGADAMVGEALAGLGRHNPSRTLILRRHSSDRLDAEASIECELWDVAGRVGFCHDQVALTGDDSRLAHAASLVAPLLLPDLPTVLWLPDPAAPLPDPLLLERAQQVLVDSARDGVPLRNLASLAESTRVHDLTWGRLEFWRAATAAAFESLERRKLLPRMTRLEVRFEGDALTPALLLAGWITARAGWRPGGIEVDGARPRGARMRRGGGADPAGGLRGGRARPPGGDEPAARPLRGGAPAVGIVRPRVRRGARIGHVHAGR